jgi:hypothetical protein
MGRTSQSFSLVALFLLLFFPALVYWQISLMQFAMKWDMMDQYFPFRYFMGECFQNGMLPWWNLHINLGYPAHADPQSAFWYPIAWLFALGGYNIYDLHAEFILHLVIAGVGFYYLLQKEGVSPQVAVLFSWCYQACGFFIGNAQHFTFVISAAWIPWIFLCFRNLTDRNNLSDILAGAWCLNFLLTGGYPALFIITQYLLGLMFVYITLHDIKSFNKQKILITLSNLSLTYLLFAVLSSGYLLSFFESKDLITRGGPVPLPRALFGSFPPPAMISLLFPLYTVQHFEKFQSDISMINGYLGLLGLIFFLPGLFTPNRLRWYWLATAIICLLVAFGKALPLREWLYHHVPLMNTFRFPSVFRLFFIMGVLILAAQGMCSLLFNKQKKHNIALMAGLSVLLTYLIIKCINSIVHSAGFGFFRFWDYNHYHQYLTGHTDDDVFLLQSSVQLLLLLFTGLAIMLIKGKKQYILLCVLVFTDLFLAAQLNMNGTVLSDAKPFSIHRAIARFPENFPLHDNLPIGQMQTFDSSLYPANTNHAIFIKTISHEGYNPFLLKNYELFETSPLRYQLISNRLFFLKNDTANPVNILKTMPGQFQAEVHSNLNDTITLMQVSYPRWKATVNSSDRKIITSDEGLMQVALDKGNNNILFAYDPGILYVLFFLQLFLVAVIGIYLLADVFRQSGYWGAHNARDI